MAQETKIEETRCSLQTFERNRYFYGKPMTVSDFEAEQRYLIGKHRYINRLVHGAGVLCGLAVTVPAGFSTERPTIEVAEGAALDCCGNLIVVSRSSTVEVKGDFDPEGLNYLYLKYTECSKQPVMLASNGSSCQEVCCYNRIQETFEVVAGRTAPGGVAKAGAGKATSLSVATTNPEEFCRALTEGYYQEHLRTCPGCDDPLVFLAVLDPEKGELDGAETAKYRSVVYNNAMLHELLCGHVSDFENPHRTTAQQVRALQSVNSVGNTGTRAFTPNIDLVSSDKTVGIAPNKNKNNIDLVLPAGAVKRSHLNEDVFNNLIESSKTVTAVANVGDKKITLHTTPAAKVTSVGGAQVVGTSSNYAPEDHAHDLSEGVVERRHLAKEVFENLLQGGGGIKVEPDAAAGSIRVISAVAPAEDPAAVTSVSGAKSVGKSERYAREDHAHDLYINGRTPNGSGQFLLTPGANVSIKQGAGENELVISSSGGGAVSAATGSYDFENVMPQEVRISDLIPHGLNVGMVAVVLAEEEQLGIRNTLGVTLAALKTVAKFGDTAEFEADAPFLMATVDYVQKTIQIRLKDRRQGAGAETFLKPVGESSLSFAAAGEEKTLAEREAPALIAATDFGATDARTYRVRWWAIPA